MNDEFRQQVTQDIDSLRKEVAALRELVQRTHSMDRVIEEYRCLPADRPDPIRWGFLGAWERGGSHSAFSVYTTTMDDYFDEPNASDEYVAKFAGAFTTPDTIKLCKYLFRNRESTSREDIRKGCGLNDEELDKAAKPLLDWNFVEWDEDTLKADGHGLYYAVTLVGLTKTAVNENLQRKEE